MSEPSAVPSQEISRLTAPFEQPIEPVRVSPLYRLGLVLVAIAMVLLPLIYVALGVVTFGVAFWIVTKVTPFSVRKEIEEDQNVALGIIIGAVIIGLAVIIGAAITG